MNKGPEANDEKVKSSGSQNKDEELSAKEMLKILMESQERAMEIALKAAVSPSKEARDEDSRLKKELDRELVRRSKNEGC